MAEVDEKVVNGTPEKDPGPSDPQDAYNRFLTKRAEKAKAAEDKKAAEPSKDEGKKGQEGQKTDDGTKTNPWEGLRVVDKDGKDAPFPLSVNGEKQDTSDLNKIGTAAQMGFHHDKKGQELKDLEKRLTDEKAAFEFEKTNLKKGMPELQKLHEALQEGRLRIDDKASKKKEEPKDEFDESQYTDPQFVSLVKEIKVLKKDREISRKEIDVLKQIQLGQFFREEKEKIDNDIAKYKDTYPLASEKEIIDFLAETDENNRPKHTVEEAMKLSQENETKRFDKYMKSDPNFQKKSDEEKDKIIQEYVNDIKEKNKVPVSAPGDSAAANAKTKNGGEDKSKWSGKKWFEEGDKMLQKKFAHAKKT